MILLKCLVFGAIVSLACAANQKKSPRSRCTGANEEFTECALKCNTCKWVRGEQGCFSNGCKPGCGCKEGYHRNTCGVCVTTEQCLKCESQPNKEFKDYIVRRGVPTCENPIGFATTGILESTDKNKDRLFPHGGCHCKEGYVFNVLGGKCILEEDCTERDRCPDVNSVWDYCTTECNYRWCFELLSPTIFNCRNTSAIVECTPGCRCKDNYAKQSKTYKCIPIDECTCDEENTELVDYPSPCRGGSCQYPEKEDCDLEPKEVGCACKEGYLWFTEDDGVFRKCVARDTCPKCFREYENFFEEPVSVKYCDAPPKMASGCSCRDNLVYKSINNLECIPAERCVCPENEVYSLTAPVCPEYCVMNKKKRCTTTAAACECKPGFVRKKAGGPCVAPENCF